MDRLEREAIAAAMKARHAYAATDNIIMDLCMGEHFMGDSFKAEEIPPLTVYVSGTAAIARLDVIQNNRVAYRTASTNSEMRFTWKDNEPQPGEAWYRVRIRQQNGQLCWSSPIWVRRE